MLPGSLIQVHPAESRLLHAQVVILNSLQAALGKRAVPLHGTGLIQALSAQVWTPKMLHFPPKWVQYAEQEVKAEGQISPRERGGHIN